jgi:type II restriction/modification system DNA methylase subunit YeeA
VKASRIIQISKSDWDSYETSWDFTYLPLLDASYRGDTLASTYSNLRAHWNEMTVEMQRLEEENNRIFIEAYGLEDELTPDVPLKEITLTCNPYYRYGDNKSDSELEELLLTDTMKELISYAVGCMFGRYSLDKPGLILANQGETYEDYCRLVPDSTFSADVDNAIPVLDGDWFSDDIVMRFRKFLRVAFGEEKYEENLRFIEKALGKDLRQYFLKDFYNDHVRRYKKRPIYWMFSSPDGSFNVLIYMHRYRPDTASIVLNEYLREYQVKLSSYMESLRRKEANPDLSKGEKVKALKELDKLRKTQDILATYERDVLFPLANQRIEIDLDDGVKVNYPKFGTALKKVPGLEAKE